VSRPKDPFVTLEHSAPSRLIRKNGNAIFGTMKITFIQVALFSFALASVNAVSAQDTQAAITPVNHIELFNGRDFSGWTFCMKDNAEPMQTWSVTNSVIHCTGKPIGYLRTTQAYSNYVVTVEWRFVKIAPKADNSGVLVHMQLPDKVWPMCIQNQGKSGRQGDLFVMAGAECKEHKGLDANTPLPMHGPSAEKPVGEWNTNVTVCAGNDVKAIINGKFMNKITECTISSGFIGIQSEGGDIEIRKMFLEPLR
jgi:hypothetical protein